MLSPCHRRRQGRRMFEGPAEALAAGAQGGRARRRTDPRSSPLVRLGDDDRGREPADGGYDPGPHPGPDHRVTPISPTTRCKSPQIALSHRSGMPWAVRSGGPVTGRHGRMNGVRAPTGVKPALSFVAGMCRSVTARGTGIQSLRVPGIRHERDRTNDTPPKLDGISRHDAKLPCGR